MDRSAAAKVDFMAVRELAAGPRKSMVRRVASAIAKAVMAVVFLGLALALIYQVVHDKQSYDALLDKYNGLLAEKSLTLAPTPVVTMAPRAFAATSVSASPSPSTNGSVVFTTTTLTQGTTITVRTTASASTNTSASARPTGSFCGTGYSGAPLTVTVTVTAPGTAANSTATAASTIVGSPAPADTVTDTRVTVDTVLVTNSGLVSQKVQTQTLTATETATAVQTDTVTADAAGAGNTQMLPAGTATSEALGVFGTGEPHTTHLPTRYPNATGTLPSYGTAYYGSAPLGSAPASTVNYTLTIPPAYTGTGTSTGPCASTAKPKGTTTSQSDPVGTVVVSDGGAGPKRGNSAGFGVLLAVVLAGAF